MAESSINKVLKYSGLRALKRYFFPVVEFDNSSNYWENRYSSGRNSGAGSYNQLSEFKASILNNFVTQNEIKTVIEFGCGDGNQLKLLNYPEYIGFDVSKTIIHQCKSMFQNDDTKSFHLVDSFKEEKADLSLSLDVIFHLVEDAVYEEYMTSLFTSSDQYVIIYSSNQEDSGINAAHVRQRKFENWIKSKRPDFELIDFIPNKFPFEAGNEKNTSFSDFYIYKKQS